MSFEYEIFVSMQSTGSPPLTRFLGPEKNRVKGGVF